MEGLHRPKLSATHGREATRIPMRKLLRVLGKLAEHSQMQNLRMKGERMQLQFPWEEPKEVGPQSEVEDKE